MTEVKLVPANVTWALRHQVLRPHQTPESVQYPEDALADARHYAAYLDGQVVGVASVYLEAEPGIQDATVWRLRGMATSPAVRGQGYGGQVLAYLLADLRALGATRIWCNARAGVSGFYLRYGFATESEPFDMPGIGPHFLMKTRF